MHQGAESQELTVKSLRQEGSGQAASSVHAPCYHTGYAASRCLSVGIRTLGAHEIFSNGKTATLAPSAVLRASAASMGAPGLAEVALRMLILMEVLTENVL